MEIAALSLQGAVIKIPQLIFAHNFAKNQRSLMQSSLLDLKINGMRDSMNITQLT